MFLTDQLRFSYYGRRSFSDHFHQIIINSTIGCTEDFNVLDIAISNAPWWPFLYLWIKFLIANFVEGHLVIISNSNHWPRGYKTWVHSQTQNKVQWLAGCGHVSAISQSLRFILSLRMYSSFITLRPGFRGEYAKVYKGNWPRPLVVMFFFRDQICLSHFCWRSPTNNFEFWPLVSEKIFKVCLTAIRHAP